MQKMKLKQFKFFDELYKLMKREISSKKYDIVIHSAAVADYAPVHPYKGKLSSRHQNLFIHLKPTVKIVDQIKKWDSKVYLVKFKLEVDLNKKRLIEKAYKSMLESNADLMVANNLKDMSNGKHKAFIIDSKKRIIVCKTKREISRKLLDIISSKIKIQST